MSFLVVVSSNSVCLPCFFSYAGNIFSYVGIFFSYVGSIFWYVDDIYLYFLCFILLYGGNGKKLPSINIPLSFFGLGLQSPT